MSEAVPCPILSRPGGGGWRGIGRALVTPSSALHLVEVPQAHLTHAVRAGEDGEVQGQLRWTRNRQMYERKRCCIVVFYVKRYQTK